MAILDLRVSSPSTLAIRTQASVHTPGFGSLNKSEQGVWPSRLMTLRLYGLVLLTTEQKGFLLADFFFRYHGAD